MLKIGTFSQISQVTIQALRHYDSMGLLEPSHVDAFTGYRYYTLDQLPRLNRILALKDLGLSLDEIAIMLREDVSHEDLQTLLRLKQAELEAQQQETTARLMRVTARLHWIDKEHNMSQPDVVIKPIKAQHVLAVRKKVATWEAMPQFFGEVVEVIIQHGLVSSSPWIAIYHDHEWVQQDIDTEIALPMPDSYSAELPCSEGTMMATGQLPGVESMASLVHKGPYPTKGDSIVAIGRWIEENGYQFAGALREVYLRGPMDTEDPEEFLTEIQVPVVKA